MIHVNMSDEYDTINGANLRFVELLELLQDSDDSYEPFYRDRYTLILDDDGSWQEVPF